VFTLAAGGYTDTAHSRWANRRALWHTADSEDRRRRSSQLTRQAIAPPREGRRVTGSLDTTVSIDSAHWTNCHSMCIKGGPA